MGTGIEVGVLGPFRAVVDDDDITERVQPSQRAILSLLAASREPVSKSDVCRIVGVSPSSLDPQLSRLRTALQSSKPVHKGRAPTSGYIALDRQLVAVDADDFRAKVAAGAAAKAQGRDRDALPLLLGADDLWRGELFDGVVLVDDPSHPARVAALTDELLDERRQARELAAWCWLSETAREGLDGDRLRRWAEEERDSAACWAAATRAVLELSGAHAALEVGERWRERASVDTDAATGGLYEDVMGRLGGTGRGRLRMSDSVAAGLREAEADRLDGNWDDAERRYLKAADEAAEAGDHATEAEVALIMARITWDPSRYEGKLEARLARLLDALPDDEQLLRARILACLAGGLYQDGSVDTAIATPYARQALELAGELEDSLTAAEVLSHARKALSDVDLPAVQLERSRRMMALARGSDYHRSLGLLAAINDLMLLARPDEGRAMTEEYREIAERTRSGYHRYFVAALDAMWALYDRRFDDFAQANAKAQALGGDWGTAVSETIQGQLLWSAYERGDHEFLLMALPVIDAVAAEGRPIPIWEVCGALLSGSLGESDDACRRLDRVARATNDLRDVQQGPLRLGALALAAMTCADLAAKGYNVRSTAHGVREQLVAHPAEGVTIGWPALYLGPKQQFVDLVAAIVGLGGDDHGLDG
jgi:hypothetical protein